MVSSDDDLPQLPAPPHASTPRENAEYFLSLLDTLAEHGTPGVATMRAELMEAIAEYAENLVAELPDATQLLEQRLLQVERRLAETLLQNVRKLEKRLLERARRTGTGTPGDKTLRTVSEGFALLVQALETMLEAAEKNDNALRAEAKRVMAQAQEKLRG